MNLKISTILSPNPYKQPILPQNSKKKSSSYKYQSPYRINRIHDLNSSFSFKKQQSLKTPSRLSTKKVEKKGKNGVINIQKFELRNRSSDNYYTKNNKIIENEQTLKNLLRNEVLQERQNKFAKKKIMSELLDVSVQLFKLSEINMKKRKNLLRKFQKCTNHEWNRVFKILANSDNENRQVIEQNIKVLVGERLFIQKQYEKMQEIMETVKI